MKKVLVLGATGSIGTSTLEILRNEKEKFVCCGLQSNGTNPHSIEKLSKEFGCPCTTSLKEGIDGIKRLIDETKPDIIVNGIAGSAGLKPSLLAIESKIDLALANKETIVMAGPLVLEKAKKSGARIIPVDSEHSAIFTLIEKCGKENVEKIILTASGGPFRTWTPEKIKNATLKDALKHPTWNMGVKITVDSATLSNKGLEVIEAKYLFGAKDDEIDVVVHPQSIVHSLVRTKDGVVYGQFSEPDMKHPIIQALEYPETTKNFMEPFDLARALTGDGGGRTLTFEKPRYDDFPLLKAAMECSKKGLAYTIAFLASGEVATGEFIKERINFSKISETVLKTLQKDWSRDILSVEDVFELDKEVRNEAEKLCS